MKKTVYGYLHTHWDREWYRDKEDFNIRLQNIIDTIIYELQSNHAPFFYFDGQVSAILDYLKYNPDKKDVIKDLVEWRKLAFGPYFVSADSFLVDFRCMLKNLELGIKYSKEFSVKKFIGYMPDIFGISQSAFKALSLKNINKAIIWRGVNPEYCGNSANFKVGNICTTWLSMGYFNDFIHNRDIKGLKKYLDKIFKYSKSSCLLPIGADHLGMLKSANQVIRYINENLDDYEIVLTNPFEYFRNSKFLAKATCNEFLDNIETYTLQGVLSTRINQKIKNANVQNKLTRIIEVLNYYLQEKYTSHIEEIYKTLLKNHAHDSICGCSLDSVANAVDTRFDKCEQMLDSILLHMIFDFKEKYKIKKYSRNKIGLFNLTNEKNLKVVKFKFPRILENAQVIKKERGFYSELLADNYKIPVTEDICDIYTQLVEVSPNKNFAFNTVKIERPRNTYSIGEDYIENFNIGLYIENNEVVIKNRKNNQTVKLSITDIKDDGDSYNFAPNGKRAEIPLVSHRILYEGKIQGALRLSYKNIELDALLDSHSKFIRFSTVIDNKRKNHKIQLCLKFDDYITKTTAQDAIGTISRTHDPLYKMEDYIPAYRPYELRTNSYPMQNFVHCNNVLALTKGLHEYETYQNELRICLLRSIGIISEPKNPARAVPAGPALLIPNAQLKGINKCEFAISFGEVHNAFMILDEFLENYVAFPALFTEDINFELDKIDKDSYFYGISEGKKILYNYRQDTISLK
ncbi:MAG: hypothetical protein IJ877_04105 [Candidatus Gastranaerophilales bacterium]|nr:hypothetical protein [Candidatus Gastranaerophilales bacterium]